MIIAKSVPAVAVLIAAVTASTASALAGDAMTIVSFERGPSDPEATDRCFGIFREESQDPSHQFISEDRVRVDLPDGREMGFLRLAYLFDAAPGSFNGWWCRVPADQADWRPYFVDGSLVVRLRSGTTLPNVLRLEIKTGGGEAVHPCYLRPGPDVDRAIAERGYADIAVPLADVVGNREDLVHVDECAIVLLYDRLKPDARKGTFLIASFRLIRGVEPRSNGRELMNDLARRAFAYFEENRHPETGLVRDRAGNFPGRGTKDSRVASIGATGFYLSTLPYAVQRGWMSRDQAEQEAARILRTVEELDHRDGLFYHWIDYENGRRSGESEVSCLDSALFLNGAVVVAEAYPSVAEAANRLIDRADWTRFVVERDGKSFLALGWTPEQGLIGTIDVRTSESLLACVHAIGSRTHSVDPSVWTNTSARSNRIAGFDVTLGRLPLFVHTIGLLWWSDPNGPVEANGIAAALANRAFCRQVEARRWATYADCDDVGGWWGITSGDSLAPDAHVAYVSPGPTFNDAAGTVWPTVALASPGIAHVLEKDIVRWRGSAVWPRVLGTYGIAPFNLDTGFIGEDAIGIDMGSLLLNESICDGDLIRNLYMRHPVPRSALDRIRFDP